MKKSLLWVVVLLLSVLMITVFSLAGCKKEAEEVAEEAEEVAEEGEEAEEEEEEVAEEKEEVEIEVSKTVALLNIGMDNDYPQAYYENLNNILAAEGIELFNFDAEWDPQLQSTQMDDAIAMKPNAIIVFATDSQAMATAIKKAYDAGIPVIMSNTLPAEESEQYTVVYYGPNNYDEGKIAGEIANDVLEGSGKVVVVEGSAGQETTISRTEGFVEALDSGIELLANQPADWRKDTAVRVMGDFLTSYGTDIDLTWTHSIDMAIGAATAVEEADLAKDEIIQVTVAGSSQSWPVIEDESVHYGIVQSPIKESEALAPFVITIVNEGWAATDKWDPYWNFMDTPIATIENYKDFVEWF